MNHAPTEHVVPEIRPANEDDPPCLCGRPALIIFTTEDYGEVTWCGA